MSNAHANLGASNASIWLNCSEAGRSMRKVKQSSKPSVYAAQGTVAHGLAEKMVVFGWDFVGRNSIGTTETLDGFDIPIDEAMIEHLKVYVDFIDKIVLPSDRLYLEERVSLDFIYGSSPAHEALFGTADCVVVSADGTEVNIADLKFGAGVPVEADGPQTLYYAAGAVYKFAPNAQKITCTIVQPRAYHEDGPIRSKVYTRADIENFLDRVRQAVKDIVSGAGGYVSGKWCRWCPMAGQCPELHKSNMAVAKGEFMAVPAEQTPPAPAILSNDELAYVLDNKDDIRRWLDAVEQETIRRLSANDPVKGYKLVAKRARKSWSYQDMYLTIAAARREIGADADALLVEDILSPAKAKEKLSPNAYQALVDAGLIDSVSSGLTLAHASDKRPGVNVNDAAKRDFEAFQITDQGEGDDT